MMIREFIHFIRSSLRQFLQRRDLQYLFLFAFILRLCYLMLMLGQLNAEQILSLSSDTVEYVGAAESLAGFEFECRRAFWIFGPGYSLFLAPVFLLFGIHPFPPLVIQAILSSLICLMLYRLGHELTGSKAVGYIAGILSAVSFTSISLSNYLLSDTLFFFVFLWGNLAFIVGIRSRKRSYFVFSGICVGGAALIRSLAQFWPVALLLFIFVLPLYRPLGLPRHGRLQLLKKAWLAPVIAGIIISGWIARNYVIHSVPTMALAGSHGLSKLAAATEAKIQGGVLVDVLVSRAEQYKKQLGKDDLTEAEQYDLRMWHFREALSEHPGKMLAMYLGLIRENALAVNDLYLLQMPRFRNSIGGILESYKNRYMHYSVLVLSGLGLLALAIRRQWLPFVYLGAFLLYMLAMIGFVLWQGSRPFFPAQMAWTILAAAALTEFGRAAAWVFSRSRR